MQLKSYFLRGITSKGVAGNTSIQQYVITERIVTSNELSYDKKYYPIIPFNGDRSHIVRTLQVNNGFGDAVVQIARVDTGGIIVFKNKINLSSYNYLLLWQGFIYLPVGMGLYCYTDLVYDETNPDIGVSVYASTILQDTVTTTVN